LLRFPFSSDPDEAAEQANTLNVQEAQSWLQVPLLGAWSADDGEIAYSGFVPNLLYQRGIVENIVIWNVGRVRWVRETLFPGMKDLPMHEILAERMRGDP
jgi:hypothetical protein